MNLTVGSWGVVTAARTLSGRDNLNSNTAVWVLNDCTCKHISCCLVIHVFSIFNLDIVLIAIALCLLALCHMLVQFNSMLIANTASRSRRYYRITPNVHLRNSNAVIFLLFELNCESALVHPGVILSILPCRCWWFLSLSISLHM